MPLHVHRPIVEDHPGDGSGAEPGPASRSRMRVAILVAMSATVAFGAGVVAASAILVDHAVGAEGPLTLVAVLIPLVLVAIVAGIAWLAVGSIADDPVAPADLPVPSDAPLDPLTGLGGHRAFHEELGAQLAERSRTAAPLAVVLLDVDDFKRVNDAAGHGTGDALLVELANLLRRGIRAEDRAYRIGGDELAVLMPGQDAENAAIAVRRLLATAIDERLGTAYEPGFSFSAGIAATAHRQIERDVLLAHAQTALARAKRDGRCAVRVWEGGEADQDLQRSIRSSAVLGVLATGGLRPAYQPMVELTTGRILAYEGLVRPPEHSMFRDTGALFEAAQEAGRTIELDLACIAAVLAGAGGIGDDQSISLNLSPRTLEAPEFGVAAFVRRLSLARWTPERVIVELTERDGVDDIERIRRVLADLRGHGIRVAADDVGAGNAGLRLLSQIHFDIVKLDLSLVQGGLRRDTSLAVVRSIADLAARWGASVIAEGVETPEQLRLIRRLGLTAAQGFLVGPPRATPSATTVDLDGLESLAEDDEDLEGEGAPGWAAGAASA